jgi:hypothetical protein
MALILSGAMAIAGASCVLDSSERCGPNQMIAGEAESCVCVPQALYTPTGCVLCGENEMPGATACECVPGFVRGAGGACEVAVAGLGSPCSTEMPCTDATYTHCATSSIGQSYCTKTGCTGDADCTNGYGCDKSGAEPFCRRRPVGLGMSCMGDPDCAGTEAAACDPFAHACVENGCSLTADSCFSGTECCDLSAFGVPLPTCVPKGACVK